MLAQYLTIKGFGSHEINIQRSRFIGYIERVETEEEAQAFIQSIKKKHYDATHNCSAYLIGDHDHIQKSNDDGEPGGTAGVPMLEVLKKQHLKNTVIVVTRYFGGVKLGAGGLIRAYGRTTSETIQATGVVQRQLAQGMSIEVDYPLLGKLENELRQSEHRLESIDYQEKVSFHVYIEQGKEQDFKDWIVDLTSDQVVISMTNSAYLEFDVPHDKDN